MMAHNQLQRLQTEQALQEALLNLMKSNPLDQITVTQLVDVAGVSRMTFYRIYDSTTDLFLALLDHVFERLLRLATPHIEQGNWQAFWSALFHFLAAHREVVQILLGSQAYTSILNYLNQAFASDIEDPMQRYYILAMIGMAFNLMVEWTQRDFDLEPEAIADLATTFSASAMNQMADEAIIAAYLNKHHKKDPAKD